MQFWLLPCGYGVNLVRGQGRSQHTAGGAMAPPWNLKMMTSYSFLWKNSLNTFSARIKYVSNYPQHVGNGCKFFVFTHDLPTNG